MQKNTYLSFPGVAGEQSAWGEKWVWNLDGCRGDFFCETQIVSLQTKINLKK